MTRVYTIREAIGELDAIRMEASRVPSISGGGATLSDQNRELSHLVSELASVMGWFARHIDQLEAEIYLEEPPELQEVGKLHAEWDGKSPHPYGCDGKDDDADNP
jgi:hypothetical protein